MNGGSRSIAALLVACMLTSPALAGPNSPPPEKDRQVANDLVKDAIARSHAGDHAAAIEIYLQAYTLVPNAELLANIGTEFQQSGKLTEALNYFCQYLERAPNGANSVYATAQAKTLQGLLGNKHVTEDNMCDLPKHKAGGGKGIKTRSHETEDPEPDPITDPTKPTPTKETKEPEHPTGDLLQPTTEPAHPSDTGGNVNGGMRTAGYVVGAAGVALLGVGVYAGIKAKDISDEISNHPANQPWPNGIQTEQAHGQHYEDAQVGTLIGGAVAVGIGVYLIIHAGASDDATDKPTGKTDKGERTVHITPTTNGFAVFGHF